MADDKELITELYDLSVGPSAEMTRLGDKAAKRIEELLADLSTAKAGLLEILRIVPLHPAGDIALATLKTIKGDEKC